MSTQHKTLYEAVKTARPIVERDGLLLDDGADLWSVDNLLTEIYNNSNAADTEADGYYIAAPDGSIGYTADNGYNIQWIYKAVKAGEREETMKKYIVEYKAGDSRMNPGVSVDYMIVVVDDVELYAEAIAQANESATYDELKASIIEQARKHGIDADTLIFWYD